MTIGERIKLARLALGYSAEQVAAYLGVSPATIYRYENGDIAKLPSKHIRPLAEFLCVSPSYLMAWSDDDEKKHTMNLQLFNEYNTQDPHIRLVVDLMETMTDEQKQQVVAIVRAFANTSRPVKKG